MDIFGYFSAWSIHICILKTWELHEEKLQVPFLRSWIPRASSKINRPGLGKTPSSDRQFVAVVFVGQKIQPHRLTYLHASMASPNVFIHWNPKLKEK